VFKRILAAIDDSERAPGVFDAAAELAQKFGATLYLVRAITIAPEFPAAAASSRADPLPAHLTHIAIAQLSELSKRAPSLLPTEPHIAVGQPWKVILETAQDFGVDLIVLGSHGYHGWDRVLGTTAGKVANLADRNVFIVHERRRGPQH
jgi:universal stress protein A